MEKGKFRGSAQNSGARGKLWALDIILVNQWALDIILVNHWG